jgi:hypothetical protein
MEYSEENVFSSVDLAHFLKEIGWHPDHVACFLNALESYWAEFDRTEEFRDQCRDGLVLPIPYEK